MPFLFKEVPLIFLVRWFTDDEILQFKLSRKLSLLQFWITLLCVLSWKLSLPVLLIYTNILFWPEKFLLKICYNLMGVALYVTSWFPFVPFWIISLTSDILIIRCLGLGLFVVIVFGNVWASWIQMLVSFPRLEKFPAIVFSNKFSASFSLLLLRSLK